MPENDDSAEAVLLQRLRGGEHSAFEQLVRQYHAPMQRFARAIIGALNRSKTSKASIRALGDYVTWSSEVA